MRHQFPGIGPIIRGAGVPMIAAATALAATVGPSFHLRLIATGVGSGLAALTMTLARAPRRDAALEVAMVSASAVAALLGLHDILGAAWSAAREFGLGRAAPFALVMLAGLVAAHDSRRSSTVTPAPKGASERSASSSDP